MSKELGIIEKLEVGDCVYWKDRDGRTIQAIYLGITGHPANRVVLLSDNGIRLQLDEEDILFAYRNGEKLLDTRKEGMVGVELGDYVHFEGGLSGVVIGVSGDKGAAYVKGSDNNVVHYVADINKRKYAQPMENITKIFRNGQKIWQMR